MSLIFAARKTKNRRSLQAEKILKKRRKSLQILKLSLYICTRFKNERR